MTVIDFVDVLAESMDDIAMEVDLPEIEHANTDHAYCMSTEPKPQDHSYYKAPKIQTGWTVEDGLSDTVGTSTGTVCYLAPAFLRIFLCTAYVVTDTCFFHNRSYT